VKNLIISTTQSHSTPSSRITISEDQIVANQWTAQQLPDLSGRTVVVTGASSGIGAVAAAELARHGARVVLAVRDVAKGTAAAAEMQGHTEVRALDLTSLESVREFASGWSGDLDILINNAGIMMVPEGRTADGFELQIGTNHLGHFALTNLLQPHITDRVVTISSDLHKLGKIHIDDLNSERSRYHSFGAYCQSKLANLLFTRELQRRLTNSGSAVKAVAAHPGVAKTNLVGHIGGVQGVANHVFLALVTQDVEHGALPTLYAATQDIPGDSYVGPDGFLLHTKGYPELARSSRRAHDAAMAARLWELSARLTKTDWPAPVSALPAQSRA
jgi:NAD(P)-dependent dehydrogenase (short-subunit alcohol dehydrogenase family)